MRIAPSDEENLSLDAYNATPWALKTSTSSCLSPQSFESAFTVDVSSDGNHLSMLSTLIAQNLQSVQDFWLKYIEILKPLKKNCYNKF